MERILTEDVIADVLKERLPSTTKFQKCSFILPNGQFYRMVEHYEAYKFLVAMGYVPCVPDAEQLLSDLGFIRYSWVGYMTLADKPPTDAQYKSIEEVLVNVAKTRDDISIQIQNNPKFYLNYELDDIPNIITKIKLYYTTGKLLP